MTSARAVSHPFGSYLLAYFLDEADERGEQIRFAVSTGPTPVDWIPLANGAPVLISNVGERGVRDPFLVRDRQRNRFVVLATDLRTWPDHDWDRAVRQGSHSIVVWESEDLVNWHQPSLVEVAPPHAGNAWAPKAFWSAERGCWLVFWASSLHGIDRESNSYQRMLVAPTLDFHSFGPAEIYLDFGHDVIDATFAHEDDAWYRFSVNALAEHRALDRGHHILMERGEHLEDAHYEVVVEDIGKGVMERGEGPAVARSISQPGWYLMIDEFGLRGYQLFQSHDLASGQWTWVEEARLPAGARHGSLLPITIQERASLLAGFPSRGPMI